jgi:hypothetical protein
MWLARRSTWTWLGTLVTGNHTSLSASFIDHPVLSSILECSMSMVLCMCNSGLECFELLEHMGFYEAGLSSATQPKVHVRRPS